MYEWLRIDGPKVFRWRIENLYRPPFVQGKDDILQIVLWYERLYAMETPNLDEIDFLIAYTKASDYLGVVKFDLSGSLSRWKARIIAGIPEENPFYPESEA
jgi:hypothetical protein